MTVKVQEVPAAWHFIHLFRVYFSPPKSHSQFVCFSSFLCLFRLKQSCLERSSSEKNRRSGRRREDTPKPPFTPLENLQPLEMAHRGPALDPQSSDGALTLASKSSRSNNIKEKISLWEGKETTHLGTLGKSVTVKRTDSLPKTQQALEKQRVVSKEKEDLGKGNADLRSCSPVEVLKHDGTVDNQARDDCIRVPKEKHDPEKENVEHSRDLRPSSSGIEQVGSLRKVGDRRTTQQANQEKRDVFSLFKKLEVMGDNHQKMPPELGNYFSPPGKDIKVEAKAKENENSGKEGETKRQENVYAQPGAPPINPIPKPKRTFQHPAAALMGKNQTDGRGQRNLPPLPPLSLKSSSKPPSGFYGRPRTVQDSSNRFEGFRNQHKAEQKKPKSPFVIFVCVTGDQWSWRISWGRTVFCSAAHFLRSITMKTSWVRELL